MDLINDMEVKIVINRDNKVQAFFQNAEAQKVTFAIEDKQFDVTVTELERLVRLASSWYNRSY